MPTETELVPLKRVVWILGSLFLTSAGITLLFMGMRSVMDIGGFCAEGGPYVIATPCPEGVPLLMIGGIWVGVIAALVYGWASLGARIPSFVGLLWPALFMSLGWNFLEYAFRPPVGDGPVWGWLIPGIVFELMGIIPLWLWMKTVGFGPHAPDTPLRSVAAIPGANVVGALRTAMSQPMADAVAQAVQRALASSAEDIAEGGAVSAAGADPGSVPPSVAGRAGKVLVETLERLDKLHASGALSDAEYEKAKRRLLA